LDDARRKGLDFGLLGGIEGVGRADQSSEYESQQERDEPDDRADHVARIGRVVFGQNVVQMKPENAETKG